MYKLVKIAPNGVRSQLSDDFDEGILITLAGALSKKYPNDQYGVTDEKGYYIWPARLATAHLKPSA